MDYRFSNCSKRAPLPATPLCRSDGSGQGRTAGLGGPGRPRRAERGLQAAASKQQSLAWLILVDSARSHVHSRWWRRTGKGQAQAWLEMPRCWL